MTDVAHELRQWLLSLSDNDLADVMSVSDSLRSAAQMSSLAEGRKGPTWRDLSAARSWLLKSGGPAVAAVATSARPVLTEKLSANDGNSANERMRSFLDRPLGKLLNFAMRIEGSVRATGASEVPGLVNDDGRSRAALEHDEVAEWAARLAELRTRAEAVAERLRADAEQVECGRMATAQSGESLSEYLRERAAFLAALAHEVSLSEADGFTEWMVALEQARRARAEQGERLRATAARRDEIENQIAELDKLIVNVVDSAVPGLSEARDRLQAELRNLPGGAAHAEPLDADVPDEVPDVEDSAENAPEDAETASEEAVQSPPQVIEPAPPLERAEAEPVEERPVLAADEMRLGFPWDEGDPPLVALLISQSRLAEAYWVTECSGEPAPRAEVLRFMAVAFAAHANSDASAALAALKADAASLEGDSDAAVLTTVGILRAGLVAGWAHPLLAHVGGEGSLPQPWSELVATCVTAVRRGHRVDASVGASLLPEQDISDARLELGRRAHTLAEELPRRKNMYQRATNVLRRLILTGQPLDAALQAVQEWANGNGDGSGVAASYALLGSPGGIDAIIDAADAEVRTPKQAKEAIVAGARRSLVRAVEEIRDLVREADVVNRRLLAVEAEDAGVAVPLSRAVLAASEAEPPPGVAGAGLSLLLAWLQEPATAGKSPDPIWSGESSVSATPSVDVLLPLHGLPWTAEGLPDSEDPRTPAALARLTEPQDVAAAVIAYCDCGDLRRARRLLHLTADGWWSVDNPAELAARVDSAEDAWKARHRRALTDARDLFARVRTQNLLDHSDETVFAGRLEALEAVPTADYSEAAARLARLTDELEDKHRSLIDELRAELASRVVDPADRERIEALLDSGDTITAAEFHAFVRAGKQLPQSGQQNTQDVREFADLLGRGASATLTGAADWARVAADGSDLVDLGAKGVRALDQLREDTRARSGDKIAVHVRDVLSTLGLSCSARPKETHGKQAGARRFRVAATPSDGSYVSVLGSAASEFSVTVVVEERKGRSVFDVLEHGDTGRANVIVYLHTLDLNARHALAEKAGGSPVQALVVDPAVLGWVAATAPGSWRATQRVTLPWTALNPYTPFVAGLVPPEVFVGRAREMSQVVDPNGGLFIYGGRQLGKSALLRRVEATFDDENRYAVYLDLKGRGIGEAEPARRIWRELAVELKRRGVLAGKVSDDAPPEVIVKQVRDWLNSVPTRRILLLADESDAFLTADSRGVPTAGGVSYFPNVLRLKELMESTDRRFKVVFAGLHQVQRFGHLSNVPLAHGGPDILVGPLDPTDARKLVVEPMAALGYHFDRPELVWRLLSATNFQASLIQIFCEELVTTMHRQGSRGRRLPVPVTEADVETVAASDRVRSKIAERLRITINLEDRYRVLTLVIALQSLGDSFGADYAPEDLLEIAKAYWPAGFEDMTASQVSIYLDEMEGLGLLIKMSGKNRYAVRSPNVVNMLGTKTDLERELIETDFDLPYEYNPREARRLLHVSGQRQRRSPLTDGQLSELIGDGVGTVVAGTDALGIARVPAAVRDYAELRGSKVEVCSQVPEAIKAITNAARRRRHTVLVADLRGVTAAESTPVCERLAGRDLAAVLVVDPAEADVLANLVGRDVVRPRRWTVSNLRSWPECPFEVFAARTRLIDATGGWPDLVEQVIERAARGMPQNQALDLVIAQTKDPGQAAGLLDKVGLPAELLADLRVWVEYLDQPGSVITTADFAAMLDAGNEEAAARLARLSEFDVINETADGVALDVVVHRCLQAVRGAR